ncbi:hypothetical protein OFO99_37375, partial [Escherichia coli]|nr:hypothetical protein [Escherichia coli]
LSKWDKHQELKQWLLIFHLKYCIDDLIRNIMIVQSHQMKLPSHSKNLHHSTNSQLSPPLTDEQYAQLWTLLHDLKEAASGEF